MIYAQPGTPGAIVSFKARYGNFIGGEFVAPAGGRYFTNTSPVNGQPIAEFPRSDAADIDKALDAAQEDDGAHDHQHPRPGVRGPVAGVHEQAALTHQHEPQAHIRDRLHHSGGGLRLDMDRPRCSLPDSSCAAREDPLHTPIVSHSHPIRRGSNTVDSRSNPI